ncbi:hypothetical protein PQX77_005200 [Marasmius sp. AFHP31]|nr:hypothetical protein PQX77_005200 [Marasmius sp. AFHP31]
MTGAPWITTVKHKTSTELRRAYMWRGYPRQPAVFEGRSDQGSNPSPASQWTFEDAYKPRTISHPKRPRNQAASGSQKMKQTRTVITPHQTRVLRELLAQSLFPSKAAKEEAGRAIGLSARSVQIWFQVSQECLVVSNVLIELLFQNQRQRARGQKKSRFKHHDDHDASTSNVSSPKYVGIAPQIPQAYSGGSPRIESTHLEPSFLLSSPANNNFNSQPDFSSFPRRHLPSVTSRSHAIQPYDVAYSSSPTFTGRPRTFTSSGLPTQRGSDSSWTLRPPLPFESPAGTSITQSWTQPLTSGAVLPPPVPFYNPTRSQPSRARPGVNSHGFENWQTTKGVPALVLQTEPQRGNNFLPMVPPTTSSSWRTRTSLEMPLCRVSFEATDNFGTGGLYKDIRDAYEYNSSPGLRNGRYDPVRGTTIPRDRSVAIHRTTFDDRTLLPPSGHVFRWNEAQKEYLPKPGTRSYTLTDSPD